jgi:Flp pilus assembly protein TadB
LQRPIADSANALVERQRIPAPPAATSKWRREATTPQPGLGSRLRRSVTMKILTMLAATIVSAVLVLPTVAQAELSGFVV